jgi:hypothetical protein
MKITMKEFVNPVSSNLVRVEKSAPFFHVDVKLEGTMFAHSEWNSGIDLQGFIQEIEEDIVMSVSNGDVDRAEEKIFFSLAFAKEILRQSAKEDLTEELFQLQLADERNRLRSEATRFERPITDLQKEIAEEAEPESAPEEEGDDKGDGKAFGSVEEFVAWKKRTGFQPVE